MPHSDPAAKAAYMKNYNRAYYLKNQERLKQATRDRYDPVANAIYQLQRNYGLTKEQAKRAWESKPDACEVCNRPEGPGQHERLCYEHDHANGNHRGWTCHRCNRAMGLCGDDPAILRKLVDYLEAGSD